MKGEDKMKQTIMGIGLIVGVLVGFVPSVDAQTQKKPVDIEACMSWKRVESPDISPTRTLGYLPDCTYGVQS